jgi:chromate transport protein ChrA
MVVYFYKVRESGLVKSMLQAVRPVVVGLLLWTAYDMALTVFGVPKYGLSGALTMGWDKLLIVLAAFAVLTFTRVNPAVIILGAAMLGSLVYR